ncbi:ImmA/IrrE family metallo-endopeptidase [Domibacillus tundrae]|uniref:ImmA/IrrE family metallo-endopeptidase n=1 Tax=Domibacillus TaxID=1433999 RepID=UPI003396B842
MKETGFAHELCYFLSLSGNQTGLSFPFVQLQELQTQAFAYRFYVPTFMLEKLNLPDTD